MLSSLYCVTDSVTLRSPKSVLFLQRLRATNPSHASKNGLPKMPTDRQVQPLPGHPTFPNGGLLFSRYGAAQQPQSVCEPCLHAVRAAGVMTPAHPSVYPAATQLRLQTPTDFSAGKCTTCPAAPAPGSVLLFPPAGTPSVPCLPGQHA